MKDVFVLVGGIGCGAVALAALRTGRIWRHLGILLPVKRIAVRLSSTDTNGAYAIVESVAAPGCSPPMHLHRNEEEHFVVLAGTYRRFGYSGDISCKKRTEGQGKSQSASPLPSP